MIQSKNVSTRFFLFLGILITLLSFTNCADPGTPDTLVGSITVSADFPAEESRSARGTSLDTDDISYSLTGIGPDGFLLERTNPSLPWLLNRLPVGNWSMTLNVMDRDGTVVLYGTEQTSVNPGAFKKVRFSLIAPTPENQVALPVFTPAGKLFSTTETVTISCSTEGSSIYYTNDGTTPTTTSTLYTSPIALTSTTTLKAMAVKSEMDNSSIATSVYTKTDQVASPSITPAGGVLATSQQVTLSCTTTGAAIYYTTDGSTPTATSTVYTGAFMITEPVTIKAIALKAGMVDSSISQAIFTASNTVATPVISPTGGSFSGSTTVTISCSTTGATIHYTLDGTTPTASSDTYVSPINVISDTTVKAIAVKNTMDTSAIAEVSYILRRSVARPNMNPSGNTYFTPQTVTITCSTADAIIRYTTDGTTPTASSLLYENAIFVDNSQTLKAIAMKTGLDTSDTASNTYVLKVTDPVFAELNTSFSQSMDVSLSCSTSGANIHYTTDGSTPGIMSNLYSAPFTISDTTTVKALAVKSGWDNSSIFTSTYTKRDIVATPVINASAITGGIQVSFTCSTASATIHYTTDGSIPTSSSQTYGTPFIVTQDTVVKAIATKTGMDDSQVASSTISISNVSMPIIDNTDTAGGQQVTLSSATNGATIYYTLDGTTPTASSSSYSAPFILTASKTVKAIAIKTGMTDSTVATKNVTIDQVATPTISPAGTAFSVSQQVTMSCATSSAVIHYTTDGTAPTSSSPTYGGAITLTNTATVQAIAVKNGMIDSLTSSQSYTLMGTVATPTINNTDVAGGQQITLSSATSGATIYYTLDGSTPTIFSTSYTASFKLTESKMVMAFAIKSGMSDSAVATKNVTVDKVATPVLTPASTSFSASQQVTMSCATSSAVIHYTLDGSTPTSSSPTYSTPLNLTTTTTVTAIAMKNGMADSTISSHGYTLLGTVATPTINNTDVAGGQLVTITSTTNGTTIYYTLDGTTPTSSSPSYISPFTLTESKTVKAFALKNGMTDSAVVTKSVTVDQVATPTINNTNVAGGQQITLTSATSGATIYYTLDGTTPSSSSTSYSASFKLTESKTINALAIKNGLIDSAVATKSVTVDQVTTPVINNADMAGGQQVTITSTTSGATIYYTLDGTTPTTSSNSYAAPFKLTESKTVKALALKSGMTDSTVATKSVTVDKVATPTISPAGTAFSTSQQVTITCATASAVIHYTIDGSTPTSSSPTYNTVLNLTATTTVKAIAVKSGLSDSLSTTQTYTLMGTVVTPVINNSDVAGGQQVAITSATPGTTIYYTLDGTTPTSSSTSYSASFKLTESKTVKAFAIKSGMTNSAVATKSVTVDQVATPTINNADTTGGQQVTITSTTSGASIYYTLDGSNPTTSSSSYAAPFKLTESKTVKALAIKAGLVDSTVATKSVTVDKVATPTISPAGTAFSTSQQVTMSCATASAVIHYTLDGSTPTSSSPTYSTTLNLTTTTTVKAIAVKSGLSDSLSTTQTYTLMGTVVTPVINNSDVAGGQQVTITSTTSGATIYYTLDGTTPTTSSSSYTTSFKLTESKTVKAFAIKSGMTNSAVATKSVTVDQVATPTINNTDVAGGQQVTITSTTSGATIYYTLDGTTPTTSSSSYTSSFKLTESKTVKALALKSGMTDSTVATKSVTVDKVATPVITPASTTFGTTQQVTITCATGSAVIHYTTDGSTPTSSSPTYSNALNLSATTTVKAIAVKSGMIDSLTTSQTYTLVSSVEPPVFSPEPIPAGFDDGQTVSISTATTGATIYYTMATGDTIPADPTAASTQYTGTISVTETATIKAIVMKSGMQSSAVVTKTYTINGSIIIEI